MNKRQVKRFYKDATGTSLEDIEFKDLKKGDIFEIRESDGFLINEDIINYEALSDAFLNLNGIWSVDVNNHLRVNDEPQIGDTRPSEKCIFCGKQLYETYEAIGTLNPIWFSDVHETSIDFCVDYLRTELTISQGHVKQIEYDMKLMNQNMVQMTKATEKIITILEKIVLPKR